MQRIWVLAFVTAAFGQQEAYTPLEKGTTAPSARYDGTVAYEPAARTIYMFGGQDNETRNDLWAYSLDRKEWSAINPTGVKPPARFGHTMILDATRNRLVVFGGQASGFFSDVWAFSLTEKTWQQLSPDNAGPSRRYGHSAIYDAARNRMVISHGFTSSGRFDDTWAFDLATGNWRDLSPPSNRPLRRCLHHAVYDGERNQMYLYGGCASGFGPCPLGDLWAFDLTTNRWSERTGRLAPSGRQHYGIAFDSARSRILLFGGSGNGVLNDTWQFDAVRGEWSELRPSGTLPAGRSRHQGVYIPELGAAVYFGGNLSNGGNTNELLRFATAPVSNAPQLSREGVVNAFSLEGGGVAPGQLITLFGGGLGPTAGAATAFDIASGALPRSSNGVQVTMNGIAAPLLYVANGQINAQVPYELSNATEAQIVVTFNNAANPPIAVPVTSTRPGLFPNAWNQDAQLNAPDNPATAGQILVLYGTGQGVTAPASATGLAANGVYPEPVAATRVLIGGQPAEILFRGQAPGTAGVMQLNVRVPAAVTPGPAVPVTLEAGSLRSQPGVTVAIR